MLNDRRVFEIAERVLGIFKPGAEAVSPTHSLARYLRKQIKDDLNKRQGGCATDVAEKLYGCLVPTLDKLVQDQVISGEEAGQFAAQVVGEIVGVDMANLWVGAR